MLKPLAVTATVIGLFATAPVLAGGSGHSHSHTHQHEGHGATDGAFHHTHEGGANGVTHTHEINGVQVKHKHRAFESVAARNDYRERVARARFQVGAGFGPYTVAEYQARVAAGQPGLVRRQEAWPTRPYRNQD